MDPFFIWLEQTSISVWIRESPSLFAFPAILALHTIGMAFLVGTSFAVSFRTLGLAPALKPETLLRFVPLMWAGFCVNATSGVALLIGYPTKALTNPLFYVKLALIGLALVGLRHLTVHVLRNPDSQHGKIDLGLRAVAGGSFLLWVAAITAGRFLAYTYTRLLSSDFF